MNRQHRLFGNCSWGVSAAVAVAAAAAAAGLGSDIVEAVAVVFDPGERGLAYREVSGLLEVTVQPVTGPAADVPGLPQPRHTSDATRLQHAVVRELMDLQGADLMW